MTLPRSLRTADVLLGAALVLVLAFVALAPAPTPPSQPARATPAPLAPSTRTYTSPQGFRLELPEGWRRSDLQSTATTEVFTSRSVDSERQALAQAGGGVGPAQALTVRIRALPNPLGLAPAEFAQRYPAAEERALYIPQDGRGRVWVVGYYLSIPGGDVPADAERSLRSVVESFHLTGP